MYLVHIVFKSKLPIETKHLLGLFYFIKQFFGRGTPRLIPTIEFVNFNLFVTKEFMHYFVENGFQIVERNLF